MKPCEPFKAKSRLVHLGTEQIHWAHFAPFLRESILSSNATLEQTQTETRINEWAPKEPFLPPKTIDNTGGAARTERLIPHPPVHFNK